MKIVLLNPNVDAARSLVKVLQDRGVPMLPCTTPKEALQMLTLHGESVDILVIHREGQGGLGEPGIDFVRKFKSFPKYSDIPFIITSESWSEAQCAEHQQSPQGANAYLKFPYTEKQFLEMIEAVSGYPMGSQVPPEPEEYTHVTSLTRYASEGAHPSAPPPPPAELTPSVLNLAHESSAQAEHPELSLSPGEEILEISAQEPQAPFSANSNLTALSMSFNTEVKPPEVNEAAPEDLGFDRAPLSSLIPTRPELGDERSERSGPKYLFRRVEDALIPGGASQSPDADTLKKYLKLREEDVHTLAQQLKHAQAQIIDLETHLKTEESLREELEHQLKHSKSRVENLELIKTVSSDGDNREAEALRSDLKLKADKVRLLELRVREAYQEIESIKERVRNDIRKMRTREKELENRIEIIKRDSEALLASRENRILELKRKLDLIEFNMDLLQDKYKKEQDKNSELDARLERAAKAMRLAGGFLGEDEGAMAENSADSLQKSGT